MSLRRALAPDVPRRIRPARGRRRSNQIQSKLRSATMPGSSVRCPLELSVGQMQHLLHVLRRQLPAIAPQLLRRCRAPAACVSAICAASARLRAARPRQRRQQIRAADAQPVALPAATSAASALGHQRRPEGFVFARHLRQAARCATMAGCSSRSMTGKNLMAQPGAQPRGVQIRGVLAPRLAAGARDTRAIRRAAPPAAAEPRGPSPGRSPRGPPGRCRAPAAPARFPPGRRRCAPRQRA